jgi:hypothetical protein
MPKAIPKLTMNDVLARLIAIANVGGGARSKMITSDLIDQEQLCDVQEKLQGLMTDVANQVPGGGLKLTKDFPYVWKLR